MPGVIDVMVGAVGVAPGVKDADVLDAADVIAPFCTLIATV